MMITSAPAVEWSSASMDQKHRSQLNTLLALCLLLAWACGLWPASAQAEASGAPATQAPGVLDFSFAIKPERMVAPGDVTMTFTITNRTGRDLQNVYLTSADGLLSEPIGQIGSGETQTLIRMHTVTQDELEAGGISYTITCDPIAPGGDRLTQTATAQIVRDDASPGVDLTRQLSSDYVEQGGVLTITYKIRNTGNVALSALRLQDSLGEFTGRLEQLNVGETKSFISRVSISGESVSSPVLEYSVPSGASFSLSLDAAYVHLANSQLGVMFSVGQSVFDDATADAILTLTNSGNSDYTNIKVLDDVYGGVIADSITLPHGGNPVEVSFSYPIRGQSQYRWRVTGFNGAGEALDLITDTMTLNPVESSDRIEPHIRAAARTPRISRGGLVTFDIDLSNAGSTMAQDVVLYEADRGLIRRLTVLPTGNTTQLSVDYDVRSDEVFSFCLDYTDEMGIKHTVAAPPVEVVIADDGVSPRADEGHAQEPVSIGSTVAHDGDQARGLKAPMKIGSTASTFTTLIVIAVALLIVLLALLVRFALRDRRARRERIAAQRQRIKEELGKTAEFTPLKRADLNGKKK